MSLGINTSNRALRWLGTTAVTTGLFVGSLGIAGAATDHKAKPHKSSPSSAPAHRGPGIKAPGGIVQAVSASSLTVVSREGVTTTFTVNSATAVVSPTGPHDAERGNCWNARSCGSDRRSCNDDLPRANSGCRPT
jgi:hypothetical protein